MQNIVVIGAGAAGLMAARELSAAGKEVTVLEARNRIGGRIHTLTDAAFDKPVEAGAEFVHGNLTLTLELLNEAGIGYETAEGSIWQSEAGELLQQDDFIEHYNLLMEALQKQEQDISVHDFMERTFPDEKWTDFRKSIYQYVEGYYAADRYRASIIYVKEELQEADDEQYRVKGGYGGLMNHLYKSCRKNGVNFFLSTPVQEIYWHKNDVRITTRNDKTFIAQKVIITVPLGVLQRIGLHKDGILFHPEIPEKREAAQQMGFGAAVKILLQFDEPFWQRDERLSTLSFVFSEQNISTWWTQHPRQSALLTGWCAGPAAAALNGLDDNEILLKAIESLATIFKKEEKELRQRLKAASVYNWVNDVYSRGGYSYIAVQAPKWRQILAGPVANTLYFAGEALHHGLEAGTVEAALQNGQQAARQLLDEK